MTEPPVRQQGRLSVVVLRDRLAWAIVAGHTEVDGRADCREALEGCHPPEVAGGGHCCDVVCGTIDRGEAASISVDARLESERDRVVVAQ